VGQAFNGAALSIGFAAGSPDLPDSSKSQLNGIVAQLAKNQNERVQLVAYAAGGADKTSETRRLSFRRALTVRSYLIEQGVSSARMDVRALGNKVEGDGPADRVDLMLVNQ
jgi:outer membrane protein OmpA-like peptidoglycan-associated protein